MKSGLPRGTAQHQTTSSQNTDAACVNIMLICSNNAHLAGELVGERDVVGLEDARDVGGGLGRDHGRERLAGDGVGRRVDAGDLDADGCKATRRREAMSYAQRHSGLVAAFVARCKLTNIEVGRDVGERHGVKDHRLEIAVGLRGARKIGKFALSVQAHMQSARCESCAGDSKWRWTDVSCGGGCVLHDGAERLGRGSPRRLLLAKAEVAEGGADVDRDGALERAVGRVGGDGVGLAERGVGVLGRRDGRVHVVHGAAVEGEGSDVGDHGGVDGGGLGRGVAVGAHGHCKF
jgi:hypothetical protein